MPGHDAAHQIGIVVLEHLRTGMSENCERVVAVTVVLLLGVVVVVVAVVVVVVVAVVVVIQ